ncbi:hypothetical protein LCGC14_1632610 [marine sediment metagenome]|uniref:DOD-type homing endonuclease domain-containing protein n=1 Tax=marine sediment metagenome TaxID=412755 RepID=A0A0F9I2F8_9ZZZZ
MFIKQRLSQDKAKIVKFYQDGESTCQLGKEFKCSSASVYLFLRDDCNIKMRERPHLFEIHIDIIKLYNEGKSGYAIAKELNIASSTAQRYMKELNLDVSHNSKIRKDPLINHAYEIVQLYNNGMGCYKLAKKYNCAESSIIRLLRKMGLKSNKYLITYDVNKRFFDNIQTEQQAYVYGFFVGDGCNYQKNGVVQIGICDLDILTTIKNVMKFTGKIYTEKRQKKHQIFYRIYIGSRYMSNRLAEIGCPERKSFKTFFPNESILPHNLVKHYIRGLTDADGSFHKQTHSNLMIWTLAGYKPLLVGIQEFLQDELNIVVHLYKHSTIHILRVAKQADLSILINWLYKDSTIYLQRKYNKIKHLLTQDKEKI